MQQLSPKRLVKYFLVGAVAAANAIGGAGAAWADPKASAPAAESGDIPSEFMDRGFAELKRGDLAAAREAFAAAWVRRPDVIVALTLAEVEMRLSRFTEAAEHWQFLILNLPPTASDQRDAAREKLELCRTYVGALTVQVAPDGSSVVVDDKPVGESPLGRELFLAPGTHSVYAAHDGRRSVGRSFQVSPGGRLSFTLTVPGPADTSRAPDAEGQMAPSPPAKRDASPPAARGENGHASLRTPLILVGGAAGLAAVAIGTYSTVKSNNASDDAASARRAVDEQSDPSVPKMSRCAGPTHPEACRALASSITDVDRFRNLAVGAFIGAGLLAAGTVGVAILWKGEASGGRRNANAAHLAVTPLLGHLNGLQLSGAF